MLLLLPRSNEYLVTFGSQGLARTGTRWLCGAGSQIYQNGTGTEGQLHIFAMIIPGQRPSHNLLW